MARTPLVTLIRLHSVALPLIRPHRSHHGIIADRRLLLVELVDEHGGVGWGECSALDTVGYRHDSLAMAEEALAGAIIPSLLGHSSASSALSASALAAIDGAQRDLSLRSEGRSLADSLGVTRTEVSVCGVVSGLPAQAATDASDLVAQGVRHLAVKIRPGNDLDVIAAVREACPSVGLGADANGSFGSDPDRLALIDRLDLEYLEQPLPPNHPAGPGLQDRLRTPIALDESVNSLSDIERASEERSGRIARLKPSSVGGIAPLVECVQTAVASGWSCGVGGMLESGVGRSLAVVLAALDGVVEPTHLLPSQCYFTEDLSDPLEWGSSGSIVVPNEPGACRAPDAARLDRATTSAPLEFRR